MHIVRFTIFVVVVVIIIIIIVKLFILVDQWVGMTSGWASNHRSGIALASCQTLMVLHLRAQGLGEENEHPPTLS